VTSATTNAVTDLILGQEPDLRRLARRLTRCESDADDLVQETLIRAYRARDRFEIGTSIAAWMNTIMRNVFLSDVITARRRATYTGAESAEAIARTESRPSAERTASRERLMDALEGPVRRALDHVPEWHRRPFLMSVVDELSCAEIGRELGLPQGTVMSRIHRARERLKQELVYAGAA
jgi:RNA polymerase sigma-70 factor (ECF subfamily)